MASTASKPRTKLSFAISYGLAGGPLPGRKLIRLLQAAGCQPAQQASEADIIIAHSGGCWLIPISAKPKLVVYIGMPLAQSQPRRTWATAKKMAFQKNGIMYTLKSSFQNLYYMLRQPRRNWQIIHHAKTAKPVIFPDTQAVFITNHYDPWPQSDMLQTYIETHDWAFISLPEAHDDIWHHPERYTAIINHYARLLA